MHASGDFFSQMTIFGTESQWFRRGHKYKFIVQIRSTPRRCPPSRHLSLIRAMDVQIVLVNTTLVWIALWTPRGHLPVAVRLDTVHVLIAPLWCGRALFLVIVCVWLRQAILSTERHSIPSRHSVTFVFYPSVYLQASCRVVLRLHLH